MSSQDGVPGRPGFSEPPERALAPIGGTLAAFVKGEVPEQRSLRSELAAVLSDNVLRSGPYLRVDGTRSDHYLDVGSVVFGQHLNLAALAMWEALSDHPMEYGALVGVGVDGLVLAAAMALDAGLPFGALINDSWHTPADMPERVLVVVPAVHSFQPPYLSKIVEQGAIPVGAATMVIDADGIDWAVAACARSEVFG